MFWVTLSYIFLAFALRSQDGYFKHLPVIQCATEENNRGKKSFWETPSRLRLGKRLARPDHRPQQTNYWSWSATFPPPFFLWAQQTLTLPSCHKWISSIEIQYTQKVNSYLWVEGLQVIFLLQKILCNENALPFLKSFHFKIISNL